MDYQIQQQLHQISEVLSLETLRFPLDLDVMSETYYEGILDFLQTHGISPYFVVRQSSHDQTSRLIRFLRRYIAKNGYRSAQGWSFEIVTDSNHPNWVGDYAGFHAFLKQYFPKVNCGLGNISLCQYTSNDSQWMQTDHLHDKVDFIALNALPMIKRHSRYSLRENIVRLSRMNALFRDVDEAINRIKATFSTIPLFLTDFNLTNNEADAINDHVFQANYYLAFLDKCKGRFDKVGYQNLFDEVDFKQNCQEFTGSTGLVTKSGLWKSGLYAEGWRQQLHPLLLLKNHHFRATYDGIGNVRILAHHYKTIGDYYSSDKDMDLYQNQNYIFDLQNQFIQLEINGIPDGHYRVTFHILDQNNGSGPVVLSKYTGLNQVNMVMTNFLKTQFQPRIYQKEIVVTGNLLLEKLILKPLELIFVEYEKIEFPE